MENRLEELLLAKEYSNLYPKEKAFVLTKISKEDYIIKRTLLINSIESFNDEYKNISLNKNIKKNLSDAFKKQKTKDKSNFLKNFITTRKVLAPTVSVVCSFVLIVLFYNFYKEITLKNNIESVTNYLLYENINKENINHFYLIDSLENHHKIADSINMKHNEMNKFLRIKNQGLDASFSPSDHNF
ncbi:hypothetical protein [Tamlana crocina]|uniref:Anti sigma-E protein RseA N-terminal domain-containing protein n=1 Tax=Tamlana crocina TaxID=393006 RepID=A0ABX1D8U0_9FLAO|nr:hypothetical protein [Tamlana crocina]NJX13999.1 hypothetical protein [Tamlana crocina]